MNRSTRSRSKDVQKPQKISSDPSLPLLSLRPVCDKISPSFDILQSPFTSKSTGLSKIDLSLLMFKREKLRTSGTQVKYFAEVNGKARYKSATALINAAQATLVFGQEEAGTAVCISPCGLLLTCSHCVADDENEARSGKSKWLIFASGEVVKAKCVAWDGRRDLALLQITAAEAPTQIVIDLTQDETAGVMELDGKREFPHAAIASSESSIPLKRPLMCIGHPGSEDLENDIPGVQTGFDVIHISEGRYRGAAADQDPEDNSEIGQLKHDCWTYWGHSGAGLFDKSTGSLIGLHSSWDDQTAMRRGIPLKAIRAFLEEYNSSSEHHCDSLSDTAIIT